MKNELIEKRTLKSKTFFVGSGIAETIMNTSNIHYYTYNQLQDISLYPTKNTHKHFDLNTIQMPITFGDNPNTDFQELVEFRKKINPLSEERIVNENEYWFSLGILNAQCKTKWRQVGEGLFRNYDVVKGGTLELEVSPEGMVNWRLLLKNEQAFNEIIDGDSLLLSIYFDNQLLDFSHNYSFINKNKDKIFQLGKPIINVPGNNHIIQDVDYDLDYITKNRKKFLILKKKIGKSGIKEIKEAFNRGQRIIIDPVVYDASIIATASNSSTAYIDLSQPTTNYSDATNYHRRTSTYLENGLVKFDGLENYNGIISAKLTLQAANVTYFITDMTANVNLCLKNWIEDEVTWSSYRTGMAWDVAGGYSYTDKYSESLTNIIISKTANTITTGQFTQTGIKILNWVCDGIYQNYGFWIRNTYSSTGTPESGGTWRGRKATSGQPKLTFKHSYGQSTNGLSQGRSIVVGTTNETLTIQSDTTYRTGTFDINVTVEQLQKTPDPITVYFSYYNGSAYSNVSSQVITPDSTTKIGTAVFTFNSLNYTAVGNMKFGVTSFKVSSNNSEDTASFYINNRIDISILDNDKVYLSAVQTNITSLVEIDGLVRSENSWFRLRNNMYCDGKFNEYYYTDTTPSNFKILTSESSTNEKTWNQFILDEEINKYILNRSDAINFSSSGIYDVSHQWSTRKNIWDSGSVTVVISGLGTSDGYIFGTSDGYVFKPIT